MNYAKNFIKIIAGNAIIAFAIVAFLEPTGIITGGSAGVGLALQHWFGIPVFITVSIINLAAFGVGWFVLGRTFALTTLLSTFAFPLFLNIFERIDALTYLTNDMLLSTLLAGAAFGLGIGIVVQAGASTGGMDIPPLVAKKLFNIPVSTGMMVCNCTVLLFQASFSNIECILYGLVNIVTMSIMLDRLLLSGTQQTQVFIISTHYEEIRKRLLSEDIGVTMVQIETGLANATQKAVLCIVQPNKLCLVKQLVEEIDQLSFMVIHTVTEVEGKGFSCAKV